MPYVLEKGRVYSVYEDYLSSLDQRLALLASLRNLNVPLHDVVALDSKTLKSKPPQDLRQHTLDDWHGDNGQDPNSTQTGWWNRWKGPAADILRETFLRALEVSLGIGHQAPAHEIGKNGQPKQGTSPPPKTYVTGVPPLASITRFWPIEFLWACGVPTLQGWITWRRHSAGWADGQVTVILTTPGINGPNAHDMYPNPEPEWKNPNTRNPTTRPGYKRIDTHGTLADIKVERGMWVIGAQTTTKGGATAASTELRDIDGDHSDDAAIAAACKGTLDQPGAYHHSQGPIVVVRPSEYDGGVLGTPTKYKR